MSQVAQQTPVADALCACGHRRRRHVRSSSGKHYCVERSCHCGDFEELSQCAAESGFDRVILKESTKEPSPDRYVPSSSMEWSGAICRECGGQMVRTGACETCTGCGSNTGCG